MTNRTTTHAQRVAIIERHNAGETLTTIAQDMHLNYYTVRKWWRRYRDQGWAGLQPKPLGRPRGALQTFDPMVKYVILKLKRRHPGWGPDTIRLALQRRTSLHGYRLPKRTALYNYIHSFYPRLNEHRRLKTERFVHQPTEVQAVHVRWQMDFKGDEQIADLGKVRPWLVCDEYTSAPLAGIIQRIRPAYSTRQIQTQLRDVFAQWGLPDQLKMDRDPLFVGSSRLEWPGVLLLWLVGLGVEPVINRPRRPTDNAQIERCGRTWREHVALGLRANSIAEVQTATNLAWQDRREYLPSRNPQCQGQAPLQAHPELLVPRRAYSHDTEPQVFDICRVFSYLGKWTWERKVDTWGSISVAHHNFTTHKDYIGQVVKVRFDVANRVFVASSVEGVELRRFTLPEITPDYIRGIGV